jgi:hypothetical protein
MDEILQKLEIVIEICENLDKIGIFLEINPPLTNP